MNTFNRSLVIRLCLGLLYVFAPLANADVLMTSGQYHETVEDLRVKVMSGFVRANRTWYEGAWHFNRRWAPLKLHHDVIDGSLSRIERNLALYEKVDDAGAIYTFGGRSTILVTDTGYRWQDRDGEWVEYDQQGRMTAYGDRNNVKVSVAYDANGNLTSVFDHFGTQVLWYEYDANGQVTAVRDETSRRVEYQDTNGLLTTVIDVLGNPWHYQYDTHGRLSKKIDALGRETTISYNASGMVSGIYDQEGIGTAYKYADDAVAKLFYVQKRTSGGRIDEYWYDREGHQVRHDLNGRTVATLTINDREHIRTDRFGNKTVITYDDWNNAIETVYPDGARTTRSYDPVFSNITRSVNENGIITLNAYDLQGNLVRKTEAVGTSVERVTEYAYDQYGQQLLERRVADAVTAEAVSQFAYDNRGNVASHTDPEGHTTTYTYDIQGNVLTRTDPRGKVWMNTYDAAGHLLSESTPLAGQTTNYEYDAVGNLVKETNAANKATTFVYDIRDNIIRRTDPYGNSVVYSYSADRYPIQETDEEGKNTWYEYDLEGRIVKTVDGNLNETTIGYIEENRSRLLLQIQYPTYLEESLYNERGRLTEHAEILSDGTRLTTAYTYDAVGNQTAVVDAKNRITRFRYDDLDRMVVTTDPMNNSVESTFDSRDNFLSLTDKKGNTHRFTYDRNNHKISEIWPLGETTRFAYDAIGNLIEKIDGKGQKAVFDYDDSSRRIQAAYYATVDAPTPKKSVSFSFDILDNLTGYADGTTSAVYSYDDLQRKISETVNFGAFNLSYSYAYYRNGKKRAFTGPDGLTYEYQYDSNNQLASVILPGNGSIDFVDYKWIAPQKISWPGGTARDYVYDDLMRTKRITDKDISGNLLLDYVYAYDEVGNVLERSTENELYAYAYDDIDRLTGVESPIGPESYEYDAAGNRLSDHHVPGLWKYNENNQLIIRGEIYYQYDANGSLIQQSSAGVPTNYVYNLENRLTEIRDENGNLLADYYYDPFGRKLWKEINGVRIIYLYNEEGLIGEYYVNGNQIKNYGYVPNSEWTTNPIYQIIQSVYYFYHNDHLGTPQKLSNTSSSVEWSTDYEAFGIMKIDLASIQNQLRFPGQYYDQESGLHYNYLRDYDPGTGRYIQSDPIGLNGGINTYSYATNNPLRNIDPKGLAACGGVCIGGAAIGISRAIAALCAKYPKTCKGARECLSNRKKCTRRLCKALNRAVHVVCDWPAETCRRGKICCDIATSLNIAETCLFFRTAVDKCFDVAGGGTDHSDPIRQARNRVRRCRDALLYCVD